MANVLVLQSHRCSDRTLAGGKAIALARLAAAGLPVPAGYCVTTAAYHQAWRAIGVSPREPWRHAVQRIGDDRREVLLEVQSLVQHMDLSFLTDVCMELLPRRSGLCEPHQRWAVRSSATNEDAATFSCAGLYRTDVGVRAEDICQAIKNVWASIWDERVVEYLMRSGTATAPPAMAVILQPMIEAVAAGVAYSIHPVTGRVNQVAVNAIHGLGVPLVEGTVNPDHYVVETGENNLAKQVRQRILALQVQRLVMRAEGLRMEPLSPTEQSCGSLCDEQLFELAHVAKRIERLFRNPVDLEWVYDRDKLWILQARPITAVTPSYDLNADECEWSRTNFKETMPEVPSPLGLSFLEHVMESFILRPYRRLGCRIFPGVGSTRIVHGRPYLNVTLMHSLVVQLGGDPSILSEQMGGQPLVNPPPIKRLGCWALIRAVFLSTWKIRQAMRRAPSWFVQMKQMATDHSRAQVERLALSDVMERLADIGRQLEEHELTFGIAAGVTQSLQALGYLLPRWLGEDWRGLLNGALQGQAQVISALQIIRLAEMADCARGEEAVGRFFRTGPWVPSTFRILLQGTEFLRLFDRYLDDYGHRGVEESDIMSPRFADQPELILRLIRIQICSSKAHSPTEILARQEAARRGALGVIKARFGWCVHRWAIFLWWYRRLCRYFALREANRHHLMFYASAGRNLLLRAGDHLVARGILDEPTDIFFIRLDEQQDLLHGLQRDWRVLINGRKGERLCNEKFSVPDTIIPQRVEEGQDQPGPVADGVLRGLPISVGTVSGPVRILRSIADWGKIGSGEIIVAPVIDPGMAPLFGIAGGLVVEMGGTLSHGAIIAREFGLPTVANVASATSILADGERITMDAGTGVIRRHGLDHRMEI